MKKVFLFILIIFFIISCSENLNQVKKTNDSNDIITEENFSKNEKNSNTSKKISSVYIKGTPRFDNNGNLIIKFIPIDNISDTNEVNNIVINSKDKIDIRISIFTEDDKIVYEGQHSTENDLKIGNEDYLLTIPSNLISKYDYPFYKIKWSARINDNDNLIEQKLNFKSKVYEIKDIYRISYPIGNDIFVKKEFELRKDIKIELTKLSVIKAIDFEEKDKYYLKFDFEVKNKTENEIFYQGGVSDLYQIFEGTTIQNIDYYSISLFSNEYFILNPYSKQTYSIVYELKNKNQQLKKLIMSASLYLYINRKVYYENKNFKFDLDNIYLKEFIPTEN